MPTATSETVTVAVTTGDTDNIAAITASGWNYVEAPNSPLGAKHNAAMQAAPKAGAYMILPSDDFVAPEWISDATAAIEGGHHYVLPVKCGIYDLATGRACVHAQREGGARRFGAGRVFSAKVVDKAGSLWTDAKERGLDTDTHARVRALGFLPHFVETDYVPLVDVKTDENLWAYDSPLQRRCAPCDAREFSALLPLRLHK